MSSPAFPEPPAAVPPTPVAEIDRVVSALASKKDDWVRTPLARRIELLRKTADATLAAAAGWVDAGCRAKGIPEGDPHAGEEWLGGPMVTLRNLRLLAEALEAGGEPVPPRLSTRPDGQIVAQVYPSGTMDKLMLGGVTAEVWIEPGKPPSQGRIYRDKKAGRFEPGKVSLVLGAGNVSSIGPMDALTKLFVDDEVVVLKTNPVNAYLGPHYEKALMPLIEEGVLAIVHGGAEVGAHLVDHPEVDTIHMTGSDRTHDAIVWGADPQEQAERKARGEPRLVKPVSSELGAVTPVFVVPGPWTADDIAYQAEHVAAMVAHNGSFNCNAAKALVLSKGWPQKQAFLEALREALRNARARKAYYPGAQQRYDAFLEAYPNAEPLGERAEDVVPWTLIRDVPADKGEHALTQEAFCGVLAVTELDTDDAESFLREVPRFGNDVAWGTLSSVLLIHPETEAQVKSALEEAIGALRYGGIGVNVWAGMIYGLVVTSWGAYPGHPLEDIQSGRGVVHNTFLFDHPERSVVRGPFRMKPKLPYFHTHKTAGSLGQALVAFEHKPSPLKLPKVIAAALRG